MNLPWLKTCQTRITAFTGAIVLLAATITVIVIMNAARFQQQLAEMQFYSERVTQHNTTQGSLLKEQIALKNILEDTKRYPPAQSPSKCGHGSWREPVPQRTIGEYFAAGWFVWESCASVEPAGENVR